MGYSTVPPSVSEVSHASSPSFATGHNSIYMLYAAVSLTKWCYWTLNGAFPGRLLALSEPISYASSNILPRPPTFDVRYLCLSHPISAVSDLTLRFLLHLKWRRDIQPLLDCWPSIEPIQPCFETFEIFHLNPYLFSLVDLGKGGNIRNRRLITNSLWHT